MRIGGLDVVLHVWVEGHGHLRDHGVEHVGAEGGEVRGIVGLHDLHLGYLSLEFQSGLLIPPFVLHDSLEELLCLGPSIFL